MQNDAPAHEPRIGGLIRKLWIGEAGRYGDHLLRLDPESRHARFGGAISDEFIRDYVATSTSLDSVLHGFFADGVLRGAAELRPVGGRFTKEAELAFSVEKPWQGHGVGSALLDRTLLVARNRGIKFLHMTCLAENRRMQQLASKFHAELARDFGGMTGEMETPRPTPLSLMREFVTDGHSLATAVLDAQARLLQSQSKRH